MTVNMLNENEIALITLFGDIDMQEVVNIRNSISSLLHQGCCQIVLDLSRVQHINATGLGILADSVRRTRVLKGDIRLANLNPYLQHVFELTGMNRVFRIYRDRQTAINGFKSLKYIAA